MNLFIRKFRIPKSEFKSLANYYNMSLKNKWRRPKKTNLLSFIYGGAGCLILALVIASKNMLPIVENMIIDMTKNQIAKISNDALCEALVDIDDSAEIQSVEKDSGGNISLIQTNNKRINLLATKVVNIIHEKLENLDCKEISIPVGDLFKNEFLLTRGFKIPIKALVVTSTRAETKNKVEEVGVNQIHKYDLLIVNIDFKVFLAGYAVNGNSVSEIVLDDSIIFGKIPQVLFNE